MEEKGKRVTGQEGTAWIEGLYAEVLEENSAEGKRRRPMHELVERVAVLGREEREIMLKWYEGEWYEETMPKGISKAKRDPGIFTRRMGG